MVYGAQPQQSCPQVSTRTANRGSSISQRLMLPAPIRTGVSGSSILDLSVGSHGLCTCFSISLHNALAVQRLASAKPLDHIGVRNHHPRGLRAEHLVWILQTDPTSGIPQAWLLIHKFLVSLSAHRHPQQPPIVVDAEGGRGPCPPRPGYSSRGKQSACCHVKCGDVRILAPVSGDGTCPPPSSRCLALTATHSRPSLRVSVHTDVRRDYFGVVSAAILRDHFDVIYQVIPLVWRRTVSFDAVQLLEGTLDSIGYPNTTSPNQLRDIVFPSSLLQKLLTVIGVAGLGNAGHTNVIRAVARRTKYLFT